MSAVTVSPVIGLEEKHGPDGSRPKRHRARRTAAVVTVSAGLAIAGATAAAATVVSAGGGTWDYGITSILPSNNWSDYYHGSSWHGSSVEGNSGLVRSACVNPGYWSYSTAYDSNPLRIDHAYWRYC